MDYDDFMHLDAALGSVGPSGQSGFVQASLQQRAQADEALDNLHEMIRAVKQLLERLASGQLVSKPESGGAGSAAGTTVATAGGTGPSSIAGLQAEYLTRSQQLRQQIEHLFQAQADAAGRWSWLLGVHLLG